MQRLFPFLLWVLGVTGAWAATHLGDEVIEQIEDYAKIRNVQYPDWFTPSFLDLREDLREAQAEGKMGIILYFGQKDCAYCEMFMKVNWGSDTETVNYTRKHFNVIAIDIWGSREITDLYGTSMTETELAEFEETNFTPSFIFYVGDGEEALRLRGYYPPYQFRAAMEYVVDGYFHSETLQAYMARAHPPESYSLAPLNEEPFFDGPPYALDRSHFPGERPLAVFFEQPDCHACDVLHSEPLHDAHTLELLDHFDAVQLNMWADTPVITPDGAKTSARKWAAHLGIFFAPTIVFFDETGEEVFRIDSVVRLYRLWGVLEYVLYQGYFNAPSYQRWRENMQNRSPVYLPNLDTKP